MRVSVFGLGYVGTVTAACLSRQGHTVIGVDVNSTKVQMLGDGRPPVVEPGLEEALAEAVDRGLLSATMDAVAAVHASDMSLICVGTPSEVNGQLDTRQVMTVGEGIGQALRGKRERHIVAVRSSVLPGTVDALAETVRRVAGREDPDDVGFAANPEFLREGTAVADFNAPPFTIIGASDARVVAAFRELYAGISGPVHVMAIRDAEILKYACNAFHAVKITFANEIGAVCKALGVDGRVVMDMLVKDTKLNVSPAYLRPGFAFGGSCLPKDVRALTHQAGALDVSVPLLDALNRSNAVQVERAAQRILRGGRRRVGLLGLAFKPRTDDLRESPMVTLVERLLGKGFPIAIYDANVNLARLTGANKRYIEHEIPHIASLMRTTPKEVVEFAEIVLIGHDDPELREALRAVRPEQDVFALTPLRGGEMEGHERYEGVCW